MNQPEPSTKTNKPKIYWADRALPYTAAVLVLVGIITQSGLLSAILVMLLLIYNELRRHRP